jgi:hypothetical protein
MKGHDSDNLWFFGIVVGDRCRRTDPTLPEKAHPGAHRSSTIPTAWEKPPSLKPSLLSPEGARLPGFELRPENIIDKMKVALAHQHADFDSHPEFSKRYVLQSPDEKPVEKFRSRVS